MSDEKSKYSAGPNVRRKPIPSRAVTPLKASLPPPPPLVTILANNLHRLRKAEYLTLKEMSVRTGFPPAQISALERGQTSVTLDTLARVAVGMNMDPAVLISDQGKLLNESSTIRLDTLETLTESIHERVRQLLDRDGPVSIDHAHLASILGAILDAITSSGKYYKPLQTNTNAD